MASPSPSIPPAAGASHPREHLALAALDRFSIETPSWGYADTGTRFGKYLQPAAARTIDEKLEDAGHVHALTGCCPKIALHARWDLSKETPMSEVARAAARRGVRIGSINPNLFEDQRYKFGSLANPDHSVRELALAHVIDCVRFARESASNVVTLWLADGSNYPGQASMRRRRSLLQDALARIAPHLEPTPEHPLPVTLLIEYKPFEPAFYHTDIPDWGSAALLCRSAGPHAKVLVDLGHHLPTTNIEQIVATLLDERLLGGFHFNDRKYADDDLTIGSIDPYQLFRIFLEIALFEQEHATPGGPNPSAGSGQLAQPPVRLEYMIDQSHNIKPKIEAMIQTVMTAQEIMAKAMLVDPEALRAAQDGTEIGAGAAPHGGCEESHFPPDVVRAESILRDAFFTDTRPMLARFRAARGLPPDPLLAHRASGYEQRVADQRTARHGAAKPSSYA